jgi:phosphohistidine phosphatase
MRAYLVQHGKPVPKEENPDRPLSGEGRADVEKVAAFLAKSGIATPEIAHSGKTRARETAEIMAARLRSGRPPGEMQGLSPLDEVHAVADELNRRSEDIMLVGHLPHLGKLASLLITGSDSGSVAAFQQGGIVCLYRDDKRRWGVAWMLVPDIISP